MFPLNPGDELVFGSPINYEEDINIYGADDHQDQLFIKDHDQFALTKSINFASTSNTGKKQNEANLGARERSEQADLRKAMHREIERKRRQEMSQLYDSLRSLIPLQQLKGKRSISDLMKEAVSYTKQLEKNVKELGTRRDELKGQSTSSSRTQTGSSNLPCHVTVNPDEDGIEILINTGSAFELSHVMIELVARELDVVSCVSTKSDDRFLHKILAQANDKRELQIDLSLMQRRLNQVVNSSLG